MRACIYVYIIQYYIESRARVRGGNVSGRYSRARCVGFVGEDGGDGDVGEGKRARKGKEKKRTPGEEEVEEEEEKKGRFRYGYMRRTASNPAAEKGRGKPQKLITDINTLTPWTLLLMYFLPFHPTGRAAALLQQQRLTGRESVCAEGEIERARERENFSPKKPLSQSFPPLHYCRVSRHFIRVYIGTYMYVYIIYIYTLYIVSSSSTEAGAAHPWRRRVDKFRSH